MFQLTNEQRRCFGITPVEADWELRQLPRSRDDYYYDTFTYIKDNKKKPKRNMLKKPQKMKQHQVQTITILELQVVVHQVKQIVLMF
jgi:hypothetical protein